MYTHLKLDNWIIFCLPSNSIFSVAAWRDPHYAITPINALVHSSENIKVTMSEIYVQRCVKGWLWPPWRTSLRYACTVRPWTDHGHEWSSYAAHLVGIYIPDSALCFGKFQPCVWFCSIVVWLFSGTYMCIATKNSKMNLPTTVNTTPTCSKNALDVPCHQHPWCVLAGRWQGPCCCLPVGNTSFSGCSLQPRNQKNLWFESPSSGNITWQKQETTKQLYIDCMCYMILYVVYARTVRYKTQKIIYTKLYTTTI